MPPVSIAASDPKVSAKTCDGGGGSDSRFTAYGSKDPNIVRSSADSQKLSEGINRERNARLSEDMIGETFVNTEFEEVNCPASMRNAGIGRGQNNSSTEEVERNGSVRLLAQMKKNIRI